jgi:hypothetical protein
VEQRGRLGVQVRVGVLAEGSGLGPGKSGLQQAVVPDRVVRAESALGHVEELGQGQEDHWPSRSSASA